ncbi:MAG: hypothetical protein WC889_10920, partial [Myxococcota bacterium]
MSPDSIVIRANGDASLEAGLETIGSLPVVAVDVEEGPENSPAPAFLNVSLGTDRMRLDAVFSAANCAALGRLLAGPQVKAFHHAVRAMKAIGGSLGLRVCNVYDTMLAEQIIDNSFDRAVTSPTLQHVCERHLDIKIPRDGPASARMPLIYRLVGPQMELLKSGAQQKIAAIESRAAPAYAAMELRGMMLDRVLWEDTVRQVSAGHSAAAVGLSSL